MNQKDLTSYLLSGKINNLEGLKTWNGSNPFQRLAIYRNNVIVSLVDALADSFPITLAIVGKDFFHAMAKKFILEHPPKSRTLAWIGDGFPYFILKFPHVDDLPYLAGIAQLEMDRIYAYYAADVPHLDIKALRVLINKPTLLPTIKFKLDPSLHVIKSSHAVFSIWAAHHSSGDFSTINPTTAESALTFRNNVGVETLEISNAEGDFINHLLSMCTIESAIIQATQQDKMFDPSNILAVLLRKQLISQYIL